MRKLFLSLILSLFVFVAASAEAISNYKELLAFAKAMNKEADISMWLNDKGEVCLDADIDMKKGKKFPGIETFKGVFDGCGHKLYNWEAKNSFCFRVAPESVIKNLVIDASCKLVAKTAYNDKAEFYAFITKINRGYIINCENYGTIEHTAEGATKQIYIGGIAAINFNVIHKCKNGGNHSSRFNFTQHTKGMSLRLGGLVGTCYGKSLSGATISCCENTGNISYMGDYPSNNLGGIVGESSKVSVKYCVNRGNVVAVGTPITTPKVSGACRVGGITGWANNDIICCDNFGQIAISGAHESMAAGIVARPNMRMNIVNCNNYAKITTNSAATSSAGGIFAHTVIDAYVSNCTNYGAISSENEEKTGWCGGIGAVIQSRKGLSRCAVVRDCMNYGSVSNKSTHKHAVAAGVVGYCSGCADKGKPVVKVRVIDCGHSGKITSAVASRTKDIVGVVKNCDVVGQRYDDVAKFVKPLKDGSTIFGRVISTDGMPVSGAVISDGLQCVLTDVNGVYTMKSDMKSVDFVTISVPAEYEIPVRDNRPQFFLRVPRNAEAVRANFILTKREKVADNYVLAMIGDPQTRGLKYDKSIERFRDVILKDVAELKEKEGKDVYAINLGDLLYNFMYTYDDYVDVLGKAACPMFSVIGNHDFDQRTLFETKMGTPYFHSYLAPENYSFNIGKIHFVVVNTIDYRRPTDKDRYKEDLEERTCAWLENDLKYVPKDATIVICGHAPIFKWRESERDSWPNFERYSKALAPYKKVYSWAGHTHQNYSYNFANSTTHPELKNVEAIIVGRCIGQIRLNRELNTDGTPNGYMVAEVNGDKMEWYYKTAGQERDYQMRAYSPKRTETKYVKVNIWNHSPETWSTPEWWENGKKVADMQLYAENDPDYLKIFAQHNEQKLGTTERKYSKPSKAPFMFRVVPSEGITSGEIRVTDQFGKTYTQKVEW